MVRKQLTGLGLTPPITAASTGTTVPARQSRFREEPPVRWIHTVLSTTASPRACLTSAPLPDTTVSRLSTGATESVPRRSGVFLGPGGRRAIYTSAEATLEAWRNRVSISPGAAPGFRRRLTRKEATDDRANETQGDALVSQGGVRDEMRSSGEVAPRLSTTIGTDGIRDALKDSGVVGPATSGVFFPTWSRDTEIPARAKRSTGSTCDLGVRGAVRCTAPIHAAGRHTQGNRWTI